MERTTRSLSLFFLLVTAVLVFCALLIGRQQNELELFFLLLDLISFCNSKGCNMVRIQE